MLGPSLLLSHKSMDIKDIIGPKRRMTANDFQKKFQLKKIMKC